MCSCKIPRGRIVSGLAGTHVLVDAPPPLSSTTSSICSWNQTKPFGQGKLSAVKVYVGSFSLATRHATVRPVASVDELTRTYEVIAAQFPERHSTAAHGLAALEARFQDDRTLMLVAVQNGVILGGALALRTGEAVQIGVIALKPEARGLGIGRRLMEAIEAEAIRLGAAAMYLGGANTENQGFYWHLGFAGRRSMMQKGLPLARRFTAEGRRSALDPSLRTGTGALGERAHPEPTP